MFKKIALLLIVAMVAFLGFASTKPNDFRIERSMTMAAPAAKIFEQVNNPRKMAAWSPWNKMDPDGKFLYEGPASGVGAVSKWSGNMNLGEGSATIVESKPNTLVKTRLDFVKPMAGSHTGEFILKQTGGTTEVTWAMYGTNNFIGKVMGLIMNCDKMVGGQFEEGLTSLKTRVEAKP